MPNRTQSRGHIAGLVDSAQQQLAALHPRTVEDHNALCLYGDMLFQGIVGGTALNYLSVFIVRLGASTLLVGLLSSLPALLLTLASVPAGRYVARQPRLVPLVVRFSLLFDLVYLLVAAVPWVAPAFAAPAVVALWAAGAVANAFLTVSFIAAMGEAVPPDRRASVISTRFAINACVAALTLQVTGQVLTRVSFPLNYQFVFAAAFLAALLSAYCLSRLHLPAQARPREATIPSSSLSGRWRALASTIRQEPAFFRYLAPSVVFRLGMNLPSALYSVFWVHVLHLSDSTIALAVTTNYAFTFLGYFLWTRLARIKGRAFILAASCIGLSCYPLLTGLARDYVLILVVSALGGLFGSGVNLAFLDVLLAVSPKEGRANYVALDTATANGMAFVGPLLGSVLDSAISIRPALFVAFAVRFLGGALFALFPVRGRSHS
jgi:MFS family permease